MEDEKNPNTVRGSIFKLLSVAVFAVICIYVGRMFIAEEPKMASVEIAKQDDMVVFDIKMGVLDIEQGEDGFTEITTAGAPELVSNRPGIRVAMDTTSKAGELMQKLLPENLTFILSTNKGTAILKCKEIKEGSPPDRLKFAFHQDEGNFKGIVNSYKTQKVTSESSQTSNPSGVLMALSYAGFKKEDQNREVPYPLTDRVNYLLTPTGVTMTMGEASGGSTAEKTQTFPCRTSLQGVDKVMVVSIKGKDSEISGEDFATKTWTQGVDTFSKTPPNGNFEAHDQNGENHFFALKCANPIFETEANTLKFETEFLENHQGQKVIPPVFEGGSFVSAEKNGVVVVIDPGSRRRAVI